MARAELESFGKFSTHAKTVLLAAQRYAEALKATLGSEHFLIALAVTPDTPAYQILRRIPITPDQLRLVLRAESQTGPAKPGLTDEAKSILERAAFQAATLHAPAIETEHILWSLVSDAGCRAYAIVQQLGVEPKTIRKTLERHFIDDQPTSALTHDIEILGIIGHAHPPKPEESHPEPVHTHEHEADPGHEHDPGHEPAPDEAEEASATPMLDEFTLDLTQLAKDGQLDPLIGREAELERMTHILGRKTKNNPVLIGEPGVGKTAIVEGLAARIMAGRVPEFLAGTRVLSLQLSHLIAGTMYRGQFEERLRRLVAELRGLGGSLLFIDEIHTLVGTGNAEGALDAANILKPLLSRGELHLIGATTTHEYQRYIERDAALERRLQPILVPEPSQAETVAILAGLVPRYQDFHRVTIDPALLDETVRLAGQYLHDRSFPDKAIDLLDEAAAGVRASQAPKPGRPSPTRPALERDLKQLRNQKEYELKAGHFERAAYLRDEEVKLRRSLKDLVQRQAPPETPLRALTSEDVRRVLSRWTGIPLERLGASDRKRLLDLELILARRIYGQAEPLATLAATIRRAKSGFRTPRRPIGVFLLAGPTGVGKTETAHVLAEELFGSQEALIQLDMSEFMERHQVARLLGAPPGYVGHEEGSRLLEQLRRRPHQVLLFDEIEKAHPDVFHLLLQIMEDGQLTDGKGRTVSCRETIILLTSNLGGELYKQPGTLGFRDGSSATPWWEEPLRQQLSEQFRPEFLSRLDGVLVFRPLEPTTLQAILERELGTLAEQAQGQGRSLEVAAAARQWLLDQVMASADGARSIRRLVSQRVGSVLADAILRWPRRHQLLLDLVRGTLTIKSPPQRTPAHERPVRRPVRTA